MKFFEDIAKKPEQSFTLMNSLELWDDMYAMCIDIHVIKHSHCRSSHETKRQLQGLQRSLVTQMTNVNNEASKASLYFTKQLFCMHGYYQGACVLFCR